MLYLCLRAAISELFTSDMPVMTPPAVGIGLARVGTVVGGLWLAVGGSGSGEAERDGEWDLVDWALSCSSSHGSQWGHGHIHL